MPADAFATLTQRQVPFARLRAFPDLFATYCTDYDAVAGFYAGDFRSAEARRAATERAAASERDRTALAEVLLDQNTRWSLGDTLDDATRQNIEALRNEEAVAVVTGQQVGLFTGPLYTPYKTLTTLQLAEKLTDETGRPVVPVFWLEGEDHDFDEVADVCLLRRNEVVRARYDGPGFSGINHGPVGRLVLTEAIRGVLDTVDEMLPDSDFKPQLMEKVRAAYQPGVALLDAFARLMRALFPEAGLVFISPDDRRLKELAAPLFRQEIEDPEASSARVQSAGKKLKEQFHAQVHARPANLFLLEEEGRLPLDFEDGRFALRGTDRTFAQNELLNLLEETPETFSPNVVLRPLVQDHLLPTAAYVAGPGEVSYFAQYKSVYEHFGVPMPVLHPRASATLVEGKVQRVLDRYGLDAADLEGDLDALFQHVVMEAMEVDVDEVFQDAARQIHQAVNALKPQVEEVDRTLAQSAESTRATLVKELDALKSRVVRAEKRNQDEVRAQLEKARVNLFPGGRPQERVLNALYFLNKYSLDLLPQLRGALSLETTAHQVIEL